MLCRLRCLWRLRRLRPVGTRRTVTATATASEGQSRFLEERWENAGPPMRLMPAVCCVVAWGGVACAEGGHFPGGGVGGLSCAKFAEMYRANPDSTNNVFGSWTQGYITGVNRARGDVVYFDMGAKTFQEMLQFLHKYCDDHPLQNFFDAAQELLESLPIRKYKDDAPASK